jgi:predicted amidohydrolase
VFKLALLKMRVDGGAMESSLRRAETGIAAAAAAGAQVVSRTLALMGAEVILSPCAWAMPADHDQAREPHGALWRENYGPVARDFRLWIAGCSNVGPINDGPWQGRTCIGCSLVVGPDGAPALSEPYGPDAETRLLIDIPPVEQPRRH